MAEPKRQKPAIQIHSPSPYETWSSSPPDENPRIQYKIFRCEIGKPQAMVILSTDWIGCTTHYFEGRTRQCRPEGCNACACGNEPRWHAYLLVFNPISHQIKILEVPKATVHQVNHHRASLAPLRGMTLTIERVPNKINGSVHGVIKPGPVPADQLPKEANVKEILERMWDKSNAKARRDYQD